MAPHPSPTRLYIGNLSPQVDEYTLIHLCSTHGKISSLSFLFHKTGPLKGKPRGYAFVEYSTREEATRAKSALHDKVLRGRKMVVTHAMEQDESGPLTGGKSTSSGGQQVGKPTAISLMKGPNVIGGSTNKKIAALEAKLAAMNRTKTSFSPSPSPGPSTTSTPATSASSATFSSLTPSEAFLGSIDLPATTTETASTSEKREREIEAKEEEKAGEVVAKKLKTQEVARKEMAKAGLPQKPNFKVDFESSRSQSSGDERTLGMRGQRG